MKTPYLAHSFDADVYFGFGAGRAIFDLAGHGEEEVKVFRDAVQLADVFSCAKNTQNTHFLRRLAAPSEGGSCNGGL